MLNIRQNTLFQHITTQHTFYHPAQHFLHVRGKTRAFSPGARNAAGAFRCREACGDALPRRITLIISVHVSPSAISGTRRAAVLTVNGKSLMSVMKKRYHRLIRHPIPLHADTPVPLKGDISFTLDCP